MTSGRFAVLTVGRIRLLNPNAMLTMDKAGVSMVRGLIESGAGRADPGSTLVLPGDIEHVSLVEPG